MNPDPSPHTQDAAHRFGEPAEPPSGPAPQGGPEELAEGISSPSHQEPTPSPLPRRSRIRTRVHGLLTHPILTGGMALTGLSLLIWSLLFRLLGGETILPVHASAMTGLPKPGGLGTPLNPEAIGALREQIEEAKSHLVTSGPDLASILARIEQKALSCGWRAEVAFKPAQPAPEGLPATILRHPVDIHLTNLGSQDSDKPAYHRLLDLFREIRTEGRKLDLTHLNLQAGPEGLNSAQVTLLIWTRPPQ